MDYFVLQKMDEGALGAPKTYIFLYLYTNKKTLTMFVRDNLETAWVDFDNYLNTMDPE